ncbi:MAG: CBS domain-containing protein [bacterium]|nr:CBS domain-containing protein [bacterium]
MKVRDLFKEKIRPVHTIAGHRSVENAIDLMTGKQATALIVTKNEEPIGIFTDRDVFRCYQRNKKRLYLIESLYDEIYQLKDYIEDLHEAGRD